jgi:uncharacterized protein
MKNILYISLSLAIMFAGCTRTKTDGPALPMKMEKSAADKAVQEIEKDRVDTQEWLRSNAHSYLAAVDRVNFGEKTTITVGSAGDNDLQLHTPDIEPHHLRITVEGSQFKIQAVDAKALLKVKDEPQREATVDPSYLQVGHFSIRLSHQNYPALIVFDLQSPKFREYKGISYFPIDLSYRFEVQLHRYPTPEQIIIMSTRGNERKAQRIGWIEFMVGDMPCRLEATHLLEPGSAEGAVDIFFRDATTGKESYPVGRYVDLKKLDNGNYLLDFNAAYNPACAYSEYYSCPIPPKENTLKVAIRAGEMDSHYH